MGYFRVISFCFCLLFASAVLSSSARNTIFLSGDEVVSAGKGRSLMVSINDYEEPSASHAHDPPQRGRAGGSGRRV